MRAPFPADSDEHHDRVCPVQKDSRPLQALPEFAANVAKVKIHCGLGAVQDISDLPGALSHCAPLKALQFAICEMNILTCLARTLDELKGALENKIAKTDKLGDALISLHLIVPARFHFTDEAHYS